MISKPVHSQFGWHIIEALGPIKAGTPAKPTPLSQVKEAIRQQLLSQDKQKEMDKWLAGIKKHYCGYDRLPEGLRAAARPGSLQDVVLDDGRGTTTG